MRFFALALVVVAFGCATPMPERPTTAVERGDLTYLAERIDWEAHEALDDGAASLTIALFDADGIFWQKGYGLADVDRETAATPETLYRVGSISKLFTAISIMQLVAQGKIDLDAPLTRYLPEFEIGPPPSFLPGASEWKLDDITIRSMLTHHSGIPSDVFKGFFTNDPVPHTEYVNLIRGWHAQAPVGFNWAYSNVALTLLGHVVERVSGESFSYYVDAHILSPSGMHASSFDSTPEVLAAVASSYLGGDEVDARSLGEIPAGGLFSSASELAAFGQMVLRGGAGPGGQVLETPLLESMFEHQNGNVALDADLEMGLGWFRNQPGLEIRGGGLAVGHSGGMIAHRSLLVLLPEEKLGAVVLTNTGESGGAASELTELALELALEARAGVPFEEREPKPVALAGNADAARAVGLEGRYATLLGNLTLEQHGDALRTQRLLYLSSAELRPTVTGSYRPRGRLLGWIPVEPDDLAEYQVRFERVGEIDAVFVQPPRGPSVLAGRRVSPSPATEAWRARVGEYRITNAGSDHLFFDGAELRLEDGLLVFSLHLVDVPLPLTRYLEPLSDDEACDWSLGRSGGTRIHAREFNGEIEIDVLGYVLRRTD